MHALKFKKTFSAVAIALLLTSCVPFIPQKVQAQVAVPVYETNINLINNSFSVMSSTADVAWNTALIAAKEVGVGQYTPPGLSAPIPITGAQVAPFAGSSADSLAMILLKPLIQNFTNSLVEWINSGFQGGPLFVTDPANFFIGVADRTEGEFIAGSDLAFLCSPFALQIRLALNLNYSAAFRDQIACTLTGVIDNVDNFINDFEQGGWAGWFSLTQNNNPYATYLAAQSELDIRLLSAQGIEGLKLNWGQGFLSWQDCVQEDQNGKCVKYSEVKTPGKVIESQLSQALGSNLRQLELAQEFDQIVAALVNQLFQQIIMQAGGLLAHTG